MLKVTTQGVYESDIGSGQKRYEEFNYTVKLTRENAEGIATHIMRRIIPYMVAKDKNKQKVPFSRIKSFIITNIEKTDEKSSLLGKDILSLNDWEIQDLACLFDLYEIPVFGKFSTNEVLYKAVETYLKKVIKIPMKDAKEKSQLDFYKQLSDGTFKLDLEGAKDLFKVYIPDGYFEKEEIKKEEKKSLAYFLQKAGVAVANTVLTATGNEPVKTQNANNASQNPQPQTGGFPSAQDLQK